MPPASNSRTWVAPVAIILVLVLLVIGAWYTGLFSAFMPQAEETATTTPQVAQQPQNDLPTGMGDTSDSAILQDSAAVDAQIQALASDSAGIDESLNDKPVTQEY